MLLVRCAYSGDPGLTMADSNGLVRRGLISVACVPLILAKEGPFKASHIQGLSVCYSFSRVRIRLGKISSLRWRSYIELSCSGYIGFER